MVARKPLVGTVAANVLEHGTGALNVDGCRIGHASAADLAASLAKNPGRDDKVTSGTYGADRPQQSVNLDGRWPPNVVLDEEAAAELDAQTGELTSGRLEPHHSRGTKTKNVYGAFGDNEQDQAFGGDTGGASRFFYCAKTSRAERNAGLDGFDERSAGMRNNVGRPLGGTEFDPQARNHHPTVKPINLMRWLVRLVTPPDGTVLDPFTGSGSTGCAAVLEGFDFIGCEREVEYVAIAEARIAFWAQHEGREVEDVLGLHVISEKAAREHADRGQMSIEEAAA